MVINNHARKIALNSVPRPRGKIRATSPDQGRGKDRRRLLLLTRTGVTEAAPVIAALIAVALLAGCAATQSAPHAVEVKIPVATPVYCNARALNKPALPIAQLTPASAPADTIRAYAASVVILKGAVEDRDEVIAGCAAPESEGGSRR